MKGREVWALFSGYHIHTQEWYSKKGQGLEENYPWLVAVALEDARKVIQESLE